MDTDTNTDTTFTLDELARWEETFQWSETPAPTLTRDALEEVTDG